MRSLFITVQILCTLLLASACVPVIKDPKVTVQSPDLDFKLPDDTQYLMSLMGCDKKDSEMTVSAEAEQNKIVVQDQIPTSDIASTDCDGKVTNSHGPIRSFSKTIGIRAPEDLTGKVNFVRVDEARSCAQSSFDANATSEKPSIYDFGSSATPAGNIRLAISDVGIQLSMLMMVRDGTNPLHISYYGKCLKYKDGAKAADASENSSCEQAELLGTKDVLLQVNIQRPEVSGVYKNDNCAARKK